MGEQSNGAADEPLIEAAEVARRLGLKRATVLDMARRGRLPSLKVGPKLVRFRWPDVLRAVHKWTAEG